MTKQNVVKMVSTLEMVGFIKTNGTQCRFVSLVSDTPVVKIKKGHPFSGLRKVATKIGIINANYNKSVRNRIAERLGVELKEVEYENGDVWYQHEMTADGKQLPLVRNKNPEKADKYYLQFFPHKSTHKYVSPSGEVIPDATVKPFLYKESERPDFKPSVIAIELANVRQLKASGVIIEMPDFEDAAAVLAD